MYHLIISIRPWCVMPRGPWACDDKIIYIPISNTPPFTSTPPPPRFKRHSAWVRDTRFVSPSVVMSNEIKIRNIRDIFVATWSLFNQGCHTELLLSSWESIDTQKLCGSPPLKYPTKRTNRTLLHFKFSSFSLIIYLQAISLLPITISQPRWDNFIKPPFQHDTSSSSPNRTTHKFHIPRGIP